MPFGFEMDERPQIPENKNPKADVIRAATFTEYIEAQAKPNRNGWKGFFHSNLFVALILWSLSQAVVIGGFIISYYVRTSQLYEWKGETAATLKRMDEIGTVTGQYHNKETDKEFLRQEKLIVDLQIRMQKSEEEGRHWEVIETEHRHLIEDVYDLRHPKK